MLINLDLGRLRALKISSNRLRDLRDRLRDLRDLRDLQKVSKGSKCDQGISNFLQKNFGVDGRIGSTAPDQIKKSMRLELFPQPIDNFECALFATPTMPAPWTLRARGCRVKNVENQRLLIKTKHFDCRPALDPSRILQGEILGRFWRFWKGNPPKILQNANKS